MAFGAVVVAGRPGVAARKRRRPPPELQKGFAGRHHGRARPGAMVLRAGVVVDYLARGCVSCTRYPVRIGTRAAPRHAVLSTRPHWERPRRRRGRPSTGTEPGPVRVELNGKDGRRETGDGRRETGDGRRETGKKRATRWAVTRSPSICVPAGAALPLLPIRLPITTAPCWLRQWMPQATTWFVYTRTPPRAQATLLAFSGNLNPPGVPISYASPGSLRSRPFFMRQKAWQHGGRTRAMG